MVYEALKAMILDGRLPPNTKLNETRTAEEMGTSPTPVREAFRMLAREGLGGKGYLDIKDFMKQYEQQQTTGTDSSEQTMKGSTSHG